MKPMTAAGMPYLCRAGLISPPVIFVSQSFFWSVPGGIDRSRGQGGAPHATYDLDAGEGDASLPAARRTVVDVDQLIIAPFNSET
jgi:hypothetical protein